MKELHVKRIDINSVKLSAINMALPCYLLTEKDETIKLIISEGVSIRYFDRGEAPKPEELRPSWDVSEQSKKG